MSFARASSLLSLTGYVSAIPTPFRNGAVDIAAVVKFCEWQIGQGIAALVVNGTTGESCTLSDTEQARLIAVVAEVAHGRVPVIAGAGACHTAHAVRLAQQAERAGASGLLAVTPYYNRPPQQGVFLHFRAIHDAAGLPILLYDVPARTGVALADDTVERLAALPRVIGLKDATGQPNRVLHLRRRLGEGFRLFSGDDASADRFIRLGGNGCISVVSNLVPALCVALETALARADFDAAKMLTGKLAPLAAALSAETNPIPVKCALSLLGWMRASVRLPLCEAAPATRKAIAVALSGLGLIDGPPQAGRPARPAA